MSAPREWVIQGPNFLWEKFNKAIGPELDSDECVDVIEKSSAEAKLKKAVEQRDKELLDCLQALGSEDEFDQIKKELDEELEKVGKDV